MTVDRDVLDDGEGSTPAPVSWATVLAYSTLAAVLVGWFFFGLLVQGQGLIDSVGESLGTGFSLLLLVSVIGMLRRARN